MGSDEDDEGDFHILTRRLVLRQPKANDAEPLTAIANDRGIAVNLATMPHPYGIEDARAWIGKVTADRANARAFVVTQSTDDALIGACGIGPTGRDDGMQIGYWIARHAWGHGFATEAARALVDHAFTRFALPHLWCSCRVTNEASRRVIEKCGFEYHDSGLQTVRALGGTAPVDHYCLDRATWETRRPLNGEACGCPPQPEEGGRHASH